MQWCEFEEATHTHAARLLAPYACDCLYEFPSGNGVAVAARLAVVPSAARSHRLAVRERGGGRAGCWRIVRCWKTKEVSAQRRIALTTSAMTDLPA